MRLIHSDKQLQPVDQNHGDIDATACRSDRVKRLENKLVPVLHRRFCVCYSFGHEFMLEVNTYEPTTICEIASAPSELEGHSCPSWLSPNSVDIGAACLVLNR